MFENRWAISAVGNLYFIFPSKVERLSHNAQHQNKRFWNVERITFFCFDEIFNVFKVNVFLLFLLERFDGFVKKCTLYRVLFQKLNYLPKMFEEECM